MVGINRIKHILTVFIGYAIFILSTLLRKSNVLLFHYHSHAFGHQSWNTEFFARKHYSETGRWPKMIGFQKRSFVANAALLRHHKSHGVWIVSEKSYLTKIVSKGSAYQQHAFGRSWLQSGNRGIAMATMGELHGSSVVEQQVQVAFPLIGDEERKAHEVLKSLNLVEGNYCCIQNIDNKYRADTERRINDFERARLSSFDALLLGAKALSQDGIKVVRVGATYEKEIDVDFILDYARDYRDSNDDFSDLAILSYAKFFTGPGSGIQLAVKSFDIPVCLINAFPWPWTENPMGSHSLVMPKKFWLSAEARFMTIQEMTELEKAFYYKRLYNPSAFAELGIEVIENTSEEIRGAMIEINSKIDGSWNAESYPVTDFLTRDNIGYMSKACFASEYVAQNRELFFP